MADTNPRCIREAREYYARGDYAAAICCLKQALSEQGCDGHRRQVLDYLALTQFSAGDLQGCLLSTEKLLALAPDEPKIHLNRGAVLARLNQPGLARQSMEQAFSLGLDTANLRDGLAEVCMRLGDTATAAGHGRRALHMKDAQVCAGFDYKRFKLSGRGAPVFDFCSPDRNIIAFALWGKGSRYLETALRNVRLCPDIYPGWGCRFYVDDSLPADFFQRLKSQLHAERNPGQARTAVQIVKMPRRSAHRTDGMFWRFRVSDDDGLDRFLVRDADSVINVRERIAVDDWIRSGKRFHIMRDAGSHTELIHGGLWGGVAGVLPKLDELLGAFSADSHAGLDQKFLRRMVWPLVKRDALIHDRYYHGVLGGVPFSELGCLPPGRHIGQNAWALRDGRGRNGW